MPGTGATVGALNRTPVAALLLAAGRSRRFGSDKRAALLQGRSMLDTSIELWMKALPPEVALTVVLRHDEEAALVARVQAFGARAMRAPGSERGLGASLADGVQALAPGSAIVVGLADMPFVRPDTIARIALRLAEGAALVAPFHQARRGHPVGFGPAWRRCLSTLEGDRGAGPLLAGSSLERLDVEDPGILDDIDLPTQIPRSDL